MRKIFLLTFISTFFIIQNSFAQKFSMMPTSEIGNKRRSELKHYFTERIQKDYNTFSKQDLKELEDLYQIANVKSHSNEAKDALIKIISTQKFEKSNRIGCAYLYLGTMDLISNNEKIEYLNIAIQKYSDSWYGDGVQVGAYARYKLGLIYLKQGQTALAYQLFDEISESYSDSIDHSGNLLKEKIIKITQKNKY